ncbi:hypothetical protein [Natronorubrum texcoconense]|uniref:Uncharacterized protein n=1 Tax=Natronorubrum texcoconense TaxID=1095776 RepID=A0A1G8YVW3_9EURY|nr:hypothetical protein [Natronorubrum texcoconense]SDK06130.1 hypothetical protein SAMN04515672_2299 [Natronorubrum texcoconense]
MSVDERLPSTTARAVVFAAVVGTLALTVHDPMAAVGIVAGLALAATMRGFAGSLWRVTVASAVLPAVVLGVVAAFGSATGALGIALLLVGTVVGVALGYIDAAWPTQSVVLRTGTAAMSAGIAACIAVVLLFWTATVGGIQPMLEAALWATGHGIAGLLGWIVIAGLLLAGGLLVVPSAAFTEPRRRDGHVALRRLLLWRLVIGAILLLVGLVLTALVAAFVPPIQSLLEGIAGSTVVRGLTVVIAVSGAVLTVLGAVARNSWYRTDERGNAVVAVVVGSAFGVGASAVAAGIGTRAGPIGSGEATVLFGATAVVLGGGWFVLWWYAKTMETVGTPDPASTIAAGLAVGVVAIAASTDSPATGVEAARTAVPSLVALAAGLFAYDVGRYGRVLAREIGSAGASRRPQLARIGWSGIVATVAVPIAAGGLWLATVVSPTLSVPATAGVLTAVVTIVVGARLLLR